jgi:ABC-type antimicrobial peptide transport system permease subunit
MLSNVFKIIRRDLAKDKVYSFISILGLSAGICVAILIIAINFTYLNYNKFHAKGDRLYQAYFKNNYMEKGVDYSINMPYLLGEYLKKDYPEVADAATIMGDYKPVFAAGNLKSEQDGCYSEPSLFNMFSFRVLASLKNGGQRIFTDNNSVAISKSLAEKYFGSVNKALGKRISLTRIYNKEDVYVSSVFDNTPFNSSIKFDYVLPLAKLVDKQSWMKNWPWGNFVANTFIELRKGADVNSFNSKIKNYVSLKNPYTKAELFLYRYDKIFLNPPGGFAKSTIITMLFVIAAVILVIAAINFINLSTSRAAKKGKEIGLRKVIGADRKSLVFRFMLETYILSFISLFLGLLLAEMLIPYINYVFDTSLKVQVPYNNIYFDLSLAGLWLIMGFLSGLYPSVYLSGLMPGSVIKGQPGRGGKIFIRKSLLGLQFVFSALFIFTSVVVYQQMKYITNKDLGLNVKQILEFPQTNSISQHFSAFTNDLSKKPGILSITRANFEPVGVGSSTSNPKWEGKPENMNDMFPVLTVGSSFIKTFNIKLLKGRDFFDEDSADVNNFIINEQMERIIQKNIKGDVVGIGLSMWGRSGKIIGVVRNFHTASLYQPIGPLIMMKDPAECGSCFIRFNTANLENILPYLKKIYDRYETDYPMNIKYLDEQYLNQHTDAKTFVGFFSLFAGIAIIISCLGLFGLTAFSIQQKTKEVGIRKVLGASVGSLSFLLTKSYLRMIFIAAVIALPAGYYLSGKLLDMFAYKTAVGPEVYIFTLGIITILAAITVIFQVLKAALANPVDSIKYE